MFKQLKQWQLEPVYKFRYFKDKTRIRTGQEPVQQKLSISDQSS